MFGAHRVSLGTVVWLVIGVIVASSHHFMNKFNTTSQIGSAILAVVIWPLVVLRIHIGI
jgi:hypothetical protein